MTEAIRFVEKIKVGVSIGDTLDAWKDDMPFDADPRISETCWGNPQITEDLVKAYLDLGFNVIRIPVTWSGHISAPPKYQINQRWIKRVREVVDYVYKNGAYVILNLHHENWNSPYYENRETACLIMRTVWSQIADYFKDYDDHLIFEGQNEPRKIGTDVEWNGGDKEGWDVVDATNQAFIEAIRSSRGKNPKRYLMIPCYGANCTNGIRHVSIPEDKRTILSVHAYEPYEFALKIPGRSKWNFDTEKIDSVMQDLKSLFLDRGIPVILGEFGAMNKESNEEERAFWAEYYVRAASGIKVPCIWWDNGRFEGKGELFGLLNRRTGACTYPKIVQSIMKGLEDRI